MPKKGRPNAIGGRQAAWDERGGWPLTINWIFVWTWILVPKSIARRITLQWFKKKHILTPIRKLRWGRGHALGNIETSV